MSKNELVSYIHALTGKSYKDARAICKAAKWNEERAFYIALNEMPLKSVIESLTRIVEPFIEIVTEMIAQFPNL